MPSQLILFPFLVELVMLEISSVTLAMEDGIGKCVFSLFFLECTRIHHRKNGS